MIPLTLVSKSSNGEFEFRTNHLLFMKFTQNKVHRLQIKIRKWLKKNDLNLEIKALICAAQKQALRTNYVKCSIDKTENFPISRFCGKRVWTVSHIVSDCMMLAQKEYKRRHKNIARLVHRKLCRR